MECQKCRKRFGAAGNVRNYKFVCPHCKHIQEDSSSEKDGGKNAN